MGIGHNQTLITNRVKILLLDGELGLVLHWWSSPWNGKTMEVWQSICVLFYIKTSSINMQESIIAGFRWTRLWWLDSLSRSSSSPSWHSLLSRLLEPLNTGSSQLECSAFDPCLYRKLPGIDQRQQTSARIMQRSNLIIMPLVFGSFTSGTLAAYEQNPGLYGTFTLLNGLLGGSVFFFHCTGNERVSLSDEISSCNLGYHMLLCFRWECCWWKPTKRSLRRRNFENWRILKWI